MRRAVPRRASSRCGMGSSRTTSSPPPRSRCCADAALDAALETFLQALLILGHELARLAAGHRPHDQTEEPVTWQVELERDLRASLACRLDGHRPDRPHRSVDAPEGRSARWSCSVISYVTDCLPPGTRRMSVARVPTCV